MKAKILEVKSDSPCSVSARVEVKDDEGNIVFDDWRGYTSLTTDPVAMKEEILDAIENIKNQIIAEQSSVLKSVTESMIGEELEI